MKKKLGEAKGLWLEILLELLSAHRNTPKTSIGETSYSLVYGTEAVIPVKVGEASLSFMDKDKALEAPRKPFTRSQAKEKQDNVVGLQWEIKKALMVEEELKNYGEDLAKCYTHFMVQVQVQEEVDWGPSTSQGGPKLGA
ncbi:PREDICTED: uncharacterized protein LOC109229937 [Nicotiana attenuata]|uniref:uncharacterized protein LOC109229937 n=1 Tax=Nicotiana attenuata TaxID=49451 RepID=UPI0009049B0C|nr:PREDICTED: uncharacterized protein LOC109229937 [Nicotiana attenuata]